MSRGMRRERSPGASSLSRPVDEGSIFPEFCSDELLAGFAAQSFGLRRPLFATTLLASRLRLGVGKACGVAALSSRIRRPSYGGPRGLRISLFRKATDLKCRVRA